MVVFLSLAPAARPSTNQLKCSYYVCTLALLCFVCQHVCLENRMCTASCTLCVLCVRFSVNALTTTTRAMCTNMTTYRTYYTLTNDGCVVCVMLCGCVVRLGLCVLYTWMASNCESNIRNGIAQYPRHNTQNTNRFANANADRFGWSSRSRQICNLRR